MKSALPLNELRSYLQVWHQSDEPLDDSAIDRLLGFRWNKVEAGLRIGKLLLQFGNELLFYEATPYALIRALFRRLDPRTNNVFYDLGAGYGQVLIYGALISRAKFRGIEIIPQRVAEANRIRDRLNLENVEFRTGNARNADFDDGDLFFFYNPFFADTLREVSRRLRGIAGRRVIRIASIGRSNDYFVRQDWLTEFAFPHCFGLRFFISRI